MADATAASNTAQEGSNWAPGWSQPSGQGSQQGAKQPSFEQAFNANADIIADDLGLDTSKNQSSQQQPTKLEIKSEPEDPQGDLELEFSPGKKLTRKEVAKQLKEYQALQKKHQELERGAGAKFRQAAEQTKQAQAQLAAAQKALEVQKTLEQVINDPDALLRAAGHDPEKYRLAAIEKAYADSQKTPEQREIDRLKEYEQRLNQVQQERERDRQLQAQQQQKQQEEQVTNQFAGNLSRSMMATAEQMKLPKSSLTIQRMANLLAGAKERGIDPTWQQLGEATRAQYVEDFVALAESLSAEDFHAKIPAKTRQKLRSFFLQQAQGPAPTQVSEPGRGPQPRPRREKQVTTQEYHDFLNKFRSA